MKRLCLLLLGMTFCFWLGGVGIPCAVANPMSVPEILTESWQAYRQQFIQTDGRVIDREADARSISEAQAYAMWRAVLVGDQVTFDRVWRWGENNLNAQVRSQDTLWAWSWGKRPDGSWGVLDESVASDADLDAAIALIFAHRLWKQPEYLNTARQKLKDLWRLCTAEVKGQRVFLPGEADLFANTESSPERLFSGLSFLPASLMGSPPPTVNLQAQSFLLGALCLSHFCPSGSRSRLEWLGDQQLCPFATNLSSFASGLTPRLDSD